MRKCSCKQPSRIGVHLANCDVFKDLTFADFKADMFFTDMSEDLLRYARVFSQFGLIPEQPEFYAADAQAELYTSLQEVFDATDFKGTSERMKRVHTEWYAAHFTPDRLRALREARVIAQEYGFTTSALIGFSVSADHFFGLYSDAS